MPIPLWATLVGISVAKKVTVLVVAKLYGIPRLYRYVMPDDVNDFAHLLLAPSGHSKLT